MDPAAPNPSSDMVVEKVGDNLYTVDAEVTSFLRLGLQPGALVEAERFFPDDPDKEGLAASVVGRIHDRRVDITGTGCSGFTTRYRFKIKLQHG